MSARYYYFWGRSAGGGRIQVARIFETQKAAEAYGRRSRLGSDWTRYRIPRAQAHELRLTPRGAAYSPSIEVANRRRSSSRLPTAADADFAYRGYLVRHGIGGRITISKDGHHIAYASSDRAARDTIELLTNPRRRARGNAGQGSQMLFHGAFGSKAAAVRKERDTPGAFIRRKKIRGKVRYLVMSPKNPPARARARSNPPRRTVIYPELLEIVARKAPGEHLNCDPACVRADHTYRHKFTSRPPVIGLEDGSLEVPA